MTEYAYVRVSTKEQNIDRQLMALEPYGIQKKTSSAITSPTAHSTEITESGKTQSRL